MHVRFLDLALFEVVFTLQRRLQVPRSEIRSRMLEIIELPTILIPGKKRWRRTFDLYVGPALSFADAFHVATIERQPEREIVSFDSDFDRLPGITRIEP